MSRAVALTMALVVALLAPTEVSAHDGREPHRTADATDTVAPTVARTGLVPDGVARVAPPAPASTYPGAVLPDGFRDEVVIENLDQPTAAEQADDGRLFVLEKSGRLLVFDDLADTAPDVALEIRTLVHNFYDRGALGLTLDPDFAVNGFVYLLYAYDHRLGDPEPAPAWGNPADPYYDECPQSQDVGCEASTRLVRYTMNGSTATSPLVLVEDWCQQFSSHSAGALEFDDAGYLYASGGEGANFDRVDWGQFTNPCDDPVDEGGRLHSQDVRTTGDPTTLSGSVIRIDPATGEGAPGNPRSGSSDPNTRRLVAHGFRNPFRIALRPGTSDLYVGDVGESLSEEVDRVGADRTRLPNFGWPCFEGTTRKAFDKPLCTSLAPDEVEVPLFKYGRGVDVVQGEDCKQDTASVSALAFADTSLYPDEYQGALAFGDYARDCIWYLPAGAGGVPDSSDPHLLVEGAGNPVDLFAGTGGDLFYVDIGLDEQGTPAAGGGKIHRINYQPGLPVARVTSSAPFGPLPLTVDFDASSSSDPAGDALTYAWDLDGDGATDDSTALAPSFTYTEAVNRVVRLTATDTTGASDTTTLRVSPGNSPPVVTIASPTTSLRWSVDQQVAFSGSATDEGVELSGTALDWTVTMAHCPGDCHSHPVSTYTDRASGTFKTIDHELPSRLVLTATATDDRGLTASTQVELTPREVALRFGTAPSGLAYRVENVAQRGPLARRAIAGERLSLSTDRTQRLDGRLWTFRRWSRGTGIAPTVVVPRSVTRVSYRATFAPVTRRLQVTTNVPGLGVRVGQRLRRPGYAASLQVGAPVSVSAARTRRVDGQRYVFVRWSNGRRATHSYRMANRATTLTAFYRRQA